MLSSRWSATNHRSDTTRVSIKCCGSGSANISQCFGSVWLLEKYGYGPRSSFSYTPFLQIFLITLMIFSFLYLIFFINSSVTGPGSDQIRIQTTDINTYSRSWREKNANFVTKIVEFAVKVKSKCLRPRLLLSILHTSLYLLR